MRLKSITVTDCPPVAHFEVADLADVVVVAGPNGVGKTRLLQRMMQLLRSDVVHEGTVIEATTGAERDAWGKGALDLSVPGDMAFYRQTLQAGRRRRHLRSSILQFESDRTIQNVQPFNFGWDITDPSEEELGWDYGFGFWKNRWQDTVHSMYRLIEAQKQSLGYRAWQLRIREGKSEMGLDFTDPMLPFRDVFTQLLAPKELVDPSARTQKMAFSLDGQEFDITALSSGEREVVNVAFDFLLRDPTDCIVFFDEPELHLHPELSHRLIQVLQGIGARNQFVLSTHSPDVITASLDKSVIFISSPRSGPGGEPLNQAIVVSEDDTTNRALRLLGHSVGIIALGRKIVLIEGEHSSLDKDVYGSIIRGRYPGLVLVPSGGKHVIQSFDALQANVLSKSIWGVEFFMLCDRDSAPAGAGESGHSSGSRLRVLDRCHLENYFLDEGVWAQAFEKLEQPDHWLRDRETIRGRLRELARDLASYATALAVTAEVRQSVGNVDIMPKDCHGKSLDEVVALLLSRSHDEHERIVASPFPLDLLAVVIDYLVMLLDLLLEVLLEVVEWLFSEGW